jgi:hypothetical protein
VNFTKTVHTAKPSSVCCALHVAYVMNYVGKDPKVSSFENKTTTELQSVGIYNVAFLYVEVRELFYLRFIDTGSRISKFCIGCLIVKLVQNKKSTKKKSILNKITAFCNVTTCRIVVPYDWHDRKPFFNLLPPEFYI